MKQSTKFFVVLVGLAFLFCGGIKAYGQQYTPEQKEVWKMEETSWELFKQGDVQKYLTLWDKSAEVWGSALEGPTTRQSYEKGCGGEGKSIFPFPSEKIQGKDLSYKLSPPSINIHDNVALVFYRCTINGVDLVPYETRVLHVWQKQGGKWLLIGGINMKE